MTVTRSEAHAPAKMSHAKTVGSEFRQPRWKLLGRLFDFTVFSQWAKNFTNDDDEIGFPNATPTVRSVSQSLNEARVFCGWDYDGLCVAAGGIRSEGRCRVSLAINCPGSRYVVAGTPTIQPLTVINDH